MKRHTPSMGAAEAAQYAQLGAGCCAGMRREAGWAQSVCTGMAQLSRARQAEQAKLHELRKRWWQNTSRTSRHIELLQSLPGLALHVAD